VKDADGHQYIDYLCGFGSMILGFGNPAVDDPAIEQLRKGDLLNQPGPAMVELAEKLVNLIDGMDWAVFSKTALMPPPWRCPWPGCIPGNPIS
jgi:glutamate-1-semialdehyde 2,1-aminomutase